MNQGKQYGLDMGKESDRLIAAIRKWLRDHVPDFRNMKLTDGEIIENYLVPAQRFVRQGRKAAAPGGLAGAFSRKESVNRELAGLASSMRYVRGSDQVKSEADKLVRKPFKNLETGFVASISGLSFKKMVSESTWGKSVSPQAHYQALGNVDTLFRLATRTLSRPGNKEEDAKNIAAIHHFDVPMPFEGQILHVEMLVKEFVRPDETGHRIYALQSVEIVTPASENRPVRLGSPSLAAHVPAGVSDRFAQMVEIVKGEVKPDDAADPDIRFSRSAAPTGATPAATATPSQTATPAAPLIRDRMKRIVDSLIYNFQDRFKPLKDIQKRRGTKRDDVRPGLRITHYKKRAVIAFDVNAEQVSIIGVFYGGQDYETILQDDFDV